MLSVWRSFPLSPSTLRSLSSDRRFASLCSRFLIHPSECIDDLFFLDASTLGTPYAREFYAMATVAFVLAHKFDSVATSESR